MCVGTFVTPTTLAESPDPTARAASAAPAESRPIRVAIYLQPDTRGIGPNKLETILTNGFVTRRIGPEQSRASTLRGFDVLIVPGGSGREQAKALKPAGREAIRKFVAAGGGYVGICAGSYLASADYDWSLKIINTRMVDRAHWARGTGTISVSFSKSGREVLKHPAHHAKMFYGQGPLLASAGRSDLPEYEVLATYRSEIARHGAPRGVMIGTTAIARAPYQKGRVICFSPHPEKSASLYHLIRHGVIWSAGDRDHGS
jgi:glutamine amidotransferase-like uncharacterized protein